MLSLEECRRLLPSSRHLDDDELEKNQVTTVRPLHGLLRSAGAGGCR